MFTGYSDSTEKTQRESNPPFRLPVISGNEQWEEPY